MYCVLLAVYCFIALHYIVFDCIAVQLFYFIPLNGVAICCITVCSVVLSCVILYSIAMYDVVLCCIVLQCHVVGCIVLCCAVLCCSRSSCAVEVKSECIYREKLTCVNSLGSPIGRL